MRTPEQTNRMGPRLLRIICLALALLAGCMHLLALPLTFASAQQVCSGPECLDDLAALTPAAVAALGRIGLTPLHFALLQSLLQGLSLVVSLGIASLIFWQRRDPMAQLVATMLAVGGPSGNSVVVVAEHYPPLRLAALLVAYLATIALVLVFYLFPDGRFRPGWTRWPMLAVAVTEFFYTFFPDAPWAPHNAVPVVETTIWFGSFIAVVGVQIYRYRFVSNAEQRRQTRWVIFGLTLSVVPFVVLIAGLVTQTTTDHPFFPLIFSGGILLFGLFLPASFGVATLRSGLFDIDVLIRRTVIYGALSLTLVGAYLVAVVVLQGLFRAVSGQTSDLAVVASTLLVAALFSPLRARLQRAIDRRFFRTRYDAQQILAGFGARLSTETDRERLTAELADVIEETLQPSSVIVWTRTPERRDTRR